MGPAMASLLTFIFALAFMLEHTEGTIPKKYGKTEEDRAKYCTMCQTTVVNIQRYLLAETTGAGHVQTSRIGSDGQKMKRVNKHLYGEEQVMDIVDRICTDES